MTEFEQTIRQCSVKDVKRLLKDKLCDVNQIEKDFRPLSFSLQNIKSKNDEWFQISRMLLNHKNIDVNAECQTAWSPFTTTLLGHVCGTKCESTLGVRMLLEDPRTDVNKGRQTPLYCALMNVQSEGDYFHQVAKLLLHPLSARPLRAERSRTETSRPSTGRNSSARRASPRRCSRRRP